ncbi:hypothetical protein ACFQ48_14330 [Hymenobacter caeli]|uniref:TonB C-terminal domain-containing protein n=1 Tax=Hymenobacter caeli TaxID=2735894 RepID=A0ABX2FSC8_9BACT|nr:hypothetical protein [Hymenobacter caeli]NRT20098.1 hypothetical protein [Hymenobacter caeli]
MSFASGLQQVHGQTTPNTTYSDPDEIRLAAPQALAQAAQKAFSVAERTSLCGLGRGFISFTCQVSSSGRIEAITEIKRYQAAHTIPASAVGKLAESIRRNVVFHVPTADKPARMSRFRRPSVVVPLKVFCK